MRILLSNDDGVHAHGLEVLYQALRSIADVTVVAPFEEMSTTGHSLTLQRPLRMIPVRKDFYAVTGSPADCIYLGVRKAMKALPDLVVSGINRGANMGQDVYYSGTVSAAREGCILGIPSLAVSLNVNFDHPPPDTHAHYESAAKLAASFLKKIPAMGLPKHTLLNLNVPDLPFSKIKGVRFAKQGFRFYSGGVLQRKDHRGRDYFWVGGTYEGFRPETGTDCDVVESGYASLTPLKLDSTDFDFLSTLEQDWSTKIFKQPKKARK